MSQNTDFRGRGRNHWFATDEDGYMTQEQRFKFVKGTTLPNGVGVPCGEGTYFPFKMTLDQIMEVYYRVRDSKFTQGSNSFLLQGYRPTRQVGWSPVAGFEMHKRGYLSYVLENPIPVEYSYQFGDAYGNPNIPDYEEYRDVIHPYALWPDYPAVKLDAPYSSFSPFEPSNGRGINICGFSNSCRTGFYDDPDDTLYGLRLLRYGGGGGSSYVSTGTIFEVSGKVAWVDADSPEDPLARFYLGCYFYCYLPEYGLPIPVRLYSGQEGFPSGGTTFETKFTLRLRSGEEFTTGLYDLEENQGGTIVLEATKWWSYSAKDGVTPIWSETTGLQLNPATS